MQSWKWLKLFKIMSEIIHKSDLVSFLQYKTYFLNKLLKMTQFQKSDFLPGL